MLKVTIKKDTQRTGKVAVVAENLSIKHEALSPNSSPTLKKHLSHSFQHLSKSIDAGSHVAVFIGWHQNKKHKDCVQRKI
jgi:hypothetical protein